MKKFIFFDLDGTLVDTLSGITLSINEYLKEFDYDFKYEKENVKTFIGNGVTLLLKKALKKDDILGFELENFKKLYIKYQVESKPYPNVLKTLKELKKRGYDLFILSNKPQEVLKELISNLKISDLFVLIEGEKEGVKRKPDPTRINEIMRYFNLNKRNGYYVGDSNVDIMLANNAGLQSIFLTYGYGNKDDALKENPTYIFNKFDDILEVLK